MAESQTEWYKIRNIDEVDSPALVIYPYRVKENIRIAIEMVSDVDRLRPHVKTHKTKEATQLLLEAGIKKFKCATIAEAEMLAMETAPDVLLAYQPVGPKLQRFLSLVQNYPHTNFSCLVDHPVAAERIADAAVQSGIQVSVFVDVNVGMNRTGIMLGAAAVRLYLDCAQRQNINPLGFHVYDGHIRNQDLSQRTRISNEIFAQVEHMKKELMEKGLKEPVIIAGGTPTFPVHAQRKDVECSPGTFIYWDRGYQNDYPEQSFLPAALVITRVISLPGENRICVDLGHKSVAAENELNRRVYFLNAPDLKPISQSEEHLVMEAPKSHSFIPGDVLYGLPYHICPTCALYDQALIAEEGIINKEWKVVARDRKIKY